MDVSKRFLHQTLDTVKNHIAVVDDAFVIVYVNKAWIDFGLQNGVPEHIQWCGQHYLAPCQPLREASSSTQPTIFDGIAQLSAGEINEFNYEYPCHSDTQQRWFVMQINRFILEDEVFFVISHQNITARVLLEQELREQAEHDSLTGIANRRAFYQYIDIGWQHYQRNNCPVSLAVIDVDDFKHINDTYGHKVGDQCLQALAKVLAAYTQRGEDMCARYGGEEFIIAWGNTTHQDAVILCENILRDINKLVVADHSDGQSDTLRVSIGLATAIPANNDFHAFIHRVDSLMYQAKQEGKNRIVSERL